MDLKRRRFLASGSAVALALSAGCVADGADLGAGNGDDAGGDENDTEDGNGDDGESGDPEDDGADGEGGEDGADESGDGDEGNGDDADSGDGEYVLVDHEIVEFSGSGDTHAEALYSASDVDDALGARGPSDDAREEVDAFVEETDFDRSVVVLMAARSPNLCYGLELEEIGADEDGLTASARAVDESADDEACAQAVHTPTLLVRAVFEDAVPRSGSISVADGMGTERGYGYSTGSDSAEASGSGSASDGDGSAGGSGESASDGDAAGDDA